MFQKKPVFGVTFFLFAFLVLFFCLAPLAMAADTQMVPCGGPGQKSCTICDFFEMTRRVTTYIVFGIIPLLAALILLFGGIYLLVNKGDPGVLSSSKTVIVGVIIGFLAVFAGWVFINTVFWALGIADWNGFKLNESWWKISAKCSVPPPPVPGCGDKVLGNDEQCDPSAPDSDYAAKYGWDKDMIALVKSKCDPVTCTAEYCGDGIVQSGEDCDYAESVESCRVRKPDYDDKKCQDEIDNCDHKCKKVAANLCADAADKSKVGLGCWLTNDITDRERYCQRGKYVCDDDPGSPTYNKVVCKPTTPKLVDECCYDRGEKLDTIPFDIVRIRDMVKLGSTPDLSNPNNSQQMVPCMSNSVTCDQVCKTKGKVCIGVGLGHYDKNKCVYVIHHDGNDCNLSGNQATNDCRAKYCLTDAPCCEGGDCKGLEPCCDKSKKVWDPYHSVYLTSTGAMFSVGETACYCK